MAIKNYLALLCLGISVIWTTETVSAHAEDARLSAGAHDVVLDGLLFHYVIAGHGPLLVVQAPGWGVGSTYLRNGFIPLERHFRVLTFDPRGSGLSSRSVDYKLLSKSDMVDDLEHLRRYWGIERLDLVGHSNGGAIAVGYAERYPTRVRKLILLGSELSGYPGKEGTEEQDAWRRKDPQFTHAIALLDGAQPQNDEEFTQWFRDTASYDLYDPAKDAPAFLETVTTPLAAAAASVYSANPLKAKMPPISALVDVKADTLILVGRQDPTCPVMVSEKLHKGIKRSKLIVYEQTGHFPWIEQPSRFFSDITRFLVE